MLRSTKRPKSAVPPAPRRKTEQVAEAQQAPTYSFTALGVTRLFFRELDRPDPDAPVKKDGRVKADIGFGLKVGLISESKADVTLQAKVVPEPQSKPYMIEVEIVGRFGVKAGTRDDFVNFCRHNAPVILFPYVRQLVHQLTSDGRYGPLRLGPMNLQAAMAKGEWKEEAVPPAPAQ